MKKSTIPFLILLLSACAFVTEGTPVDTDASSSDSGESESTLSASATSSPTGTSTSSSSNSGSDDSVGSSDESGDDDPTFGESATTTHGESTTGEPVEDWALDFDGTSYARKDDDGSSFEWTATDFTVELWAQILDVDTAHGVIFDTTNAQFTNGWVLYLHNDWRALVFSFFDVPGNNNVVTGPSVEEIGTGWHHFAATKQSGSVTLYVDGVAVTTEVVPTSMAFDNDARWALGGNAVDNPDFRLTDVVVDDVRVSGLARYSADFVPPSSYDPDDTDVILTLELDEGEGEVVVSADGYASFSLESPTWVAGNSE